MISTLIFFLGAAAGAIGASIAIAVMDRPRCEHVPRLLPFAHKLLEPCCADNPIAHSMGGTRPALPYVSEYGCRCSPNQVAYNQFNRVPCKCTGYPYAHDAWPDAIDIKDKLKEEWKRPPPMPMPGEPMKRSG